MATAANVPAISVLIVNYNTTDCLVGCLRSLQEAAVALPHEVIVVDNRSNDGVGRVAIEFPWVRLIENSENRFYAAGVNQAWRAARGDVVLLLGTDVLVRPDSLERMYAALVADPVRAAVGCRLAQPDGQVEASVRAEMTPGYFVCNFSLVGRMFPRYRQTLNYRLEYGNWDRRSNRDVGSCAASCLMLRRDLIDSLGGYGDGFRLYFVEDDICRRIRATGRRIYFLGEQENTHLGQVSVKREQPTLIREIWRADARQYARRHFGRITAELIVALMALTDGLRVIQTGLSRIGLVRPPRPWWNADTF